MIACGKQKKKLTKEKIMNLVEKYLGEKYTSVKGEKYLGSSFFIHVKPEKNKWEVIHSSLKDVNSGGGQVLKTIKDKKEAIKFARKMASKDKELIIIWRVEGSGYRVEEYMTY